MAGYIDRSGKVVIEPVFQAFGNGGDEFVEGYRWKLSGHEDKQGKPVDFGGLKPWRFSEGLAPALREGRYGYIDRSGRFVIPPVLPAHEGRPDDFSEGLATVKADGLYGFINKTGAVVIAPAFLAAEPFHDGMARVIMEGPCSYGSNAPCGDATTVGASQTRGASATLPPCRFTFADTTGRVLTRRFEEASDFSEGVAAVREGQRWGYVDKAGVAVIAPRFLRALPFSDGLAAVEVEAGPERRMGYIDKTGTMVIPAAYLSGAPFREGLAAVTETYRGPSWYIDKDGIAKFGRTFATAGDFRFGLAHVRLRDREFAYIDVTGKDVFTYLDEPEPWPIIKPQVR